MGVDRTEASVGEKSAACQPGLLIQLYIGRTAKNPMTNGERNSNRTTYLGSIAGNDQMESAIM
jgi:hypothetical protein